MSLKPSVGSWTVRAGSYPFSAIVGQESMKLALLLLAVSPDIGGVLLSGEKGTAKSTAVRALAALMPDVACFLGCEYACDPDDARNWCPHCRESASKDCVMHRPARVLTLPLGATEDMVRGSLDFATALRQGRLTARPGLLAQANRGVLYIDEVNLLGDHLANLILDAAVSGRNIIEREGVSLSHEARFSLIGTMNPEEGPLRPQLLDRFGLCVEVSAEQALDIRVELMERRERFESCPQASFREYADQEQALAGRLRRSRVLLRQARLDPAARGFIVELAASHRVAGHRAELALARAALAHSVWNGRTLATTKDVLAVAEMALVHRRRESLPPNAQSKHDDQPGHEDSSQGRKGENPNDRTLDRSAPMDGEADNWQDAQEDEDICREEQGNASGPDSPENNTARESAPDQVHDVGTVFNVKALSPPEDRLVRKGSGRRMSTRTDQNHGRCVGYRQSTECRDLALDATLRAAAPHQARRGKTAGLAVDIRPQDWRRKVREKRVGGLVLFLVDASGSMGARGRMAASKGAVMSLLLDAYQKRDRVAMMTFRRNGAGLALPPTSSIEMASRLLADLPVGGRTPLGPALATGYEFLKTEQHRAPSMRPLAVLITDGKATAPLHAGANAMNESLGLAERIGQDKRIHWIVIDTEEPGIVRFQLAAPLATALGGEYFGIDGLRSGDIVNILKGYA